MTSVIIPPLRDGRTILAWQIAALSRQKKLPKLESLLSDIGEPEDVGPKMKAMLLEHNARRE